ncbi:restriction endonuclease subunit S [Anabaena subtropica]|uniref:Restriction endonuclease subunit S n=1 Tax=Anabaena subtropica FACHB-260 TaxID=2692884 RepID=A0ABR8CMP8_9NOST|nr:restriction endonuclease subunit S [Anabaena subtropica]MBD2343619.1 restriction endonuclease subunit S [Anabaena subtropica FACHB-260]
MKVDTFFKNFELLTDAPNAIVKLREIILQLSVCGKLSQQADDECASILVSEAQKKLAKLIDEKKYRNFEKVLPVKLDEQPYKIPQNWKWVRIGEIALVRGGKRLPQGASFAIIPTPYIYIQVTNMKNGTIVNDGLKYIDEDVYQAIKNYIIEKEDLYISIAGTIGQVGEVPDFYHQMNLTENAARIIFKELNKKYFLTALNSNIVQSQFKEKTNQQAQPKLALKRIADAIIPLPPLAEQKRIVEKCDRLLSTCDEIEKRQQQRQESIVRMNESAIAQLLSSQNPDEFRQHWQRICNNFDLLYSIPETIPKLRQAILQLAVQGKLVRQNISDECGSDTPPRLLINDKTLRVSFPNLVDKRFFNLYNNSLIARKYYAGQGTGTSNSMKNITREQIRNLPVPLPPLAEQKRIVEKCDRLMSLCDTLEAKLKQGRDSSEKLMEVAAKQVLTA